MELAKVALVHHTFPHRGLPVYGLRSSWVRRSADVASRNPFYTIKLDAGRSRAALDAGPGFVNTRVSESHPSGDAFFNNASQSEHYLQSVRLGRNPPARRYHRRSRPAKSNCRFNLVGEMPEVRGAEPASAARPSFQTGVVTN